MDSTTARTWLPVGAVIIIIAVGAYAFTHRTVAPAPTPGTSLTSSTTATLPPVINDFWGGGKPVNLLDATLIVKELDSSTSTVQVDKATLGLVSTSTSPTYYLKDANNVYFFDAGSNENQQPRPRKKNPNPAPTPYILYRLPLSAASFRIINYDYVADDTHVYYKTGHVNDNDQIDGHSFTAVEGIDPKTAYDPNPHVPGIDYINGTGTILVADAKEVYYGTQELAPNQNFHFLDWTSGGTTYSTIYAVSGSSVVCISGGEHHVLSTAVSTFAPVLISGENFYAKDGAGQVFVNCNPLDSGKTTSTFAWETASAQANPPYTLLLTDSGLYDANGKFLVTRTGTPSGFKYLNDTGEYFALDGKAYWYATDSYIKDNGATPTLINGGNVDISSFTVLKAWNDVKLGRYAGVARDANRVYVDNYRDYYKAIVDEHVFVPKDISAFTVLDCPSLAVYFWDSVAVYSEDGSVVTDANPATFATNDSRCSEPFNWDGY